MASPNTSGSFNPEGPNQIAEQATLNSLLLEVQARVGNNQPQPDGHRYGAFTTMDDTGKRQWIGLHQIPIEASAHGEVALIHTQELEGDPSHKHYYFFPTEEGIRIQESEPDVSILFDIVDSEFNAGRDFKEQLEIIGQKYDDERFKAIEQENELGLGAVSEAQAQELLAKIRTAEPFHKASPEAVPPPDNEAAYLENAAEAMNEASEPVIAELGALVVAEATDLTKDDAQAPELVERITEFKDDNDLNEQWSKKIDSPIDTGIVSGAEAYLQQQADMDPVETLREIDELINLGNDQEVYGLTIDKNNANRREEADGMVEYQAASGNWIKEAAVDSAHARWIDNPTALNRARWFVKQKTIHPEF